MLGWLSNLMGRATIGKPDSRPRVIQARVVRAKYDAAQTTADNRRHWANADLLSPDAAASPAVRRILRSRARYEVANNPYAKGIVLTLANDVIGTGPRLQVLTGDAEVNQTVEREFARWARAVGLAEKLRTMRMAKTTDGEAFAVLFSNEKLSSPVKLDLKLLEADQVATPTLAQGGKARKPTDNAVARGRAAWAHTSSVLAMIANVNRDPKRSRPFQPADFDPHPLADRDERLPAGKAGFETLKRVFTDRSN